MITTTYNYSSGAGFNYDATKIGFGGGAAKLILVPDTGLTFVPSIGASTYDPSVLEFVGGVLRQKDQRPAHATAYAAWSTGLDLNWGNGALTVTPVNGAAIASGALDLTGGTHKSVNFVATGNASSLQTGTIECVWIPNYSGTPPNPQVILNLSAMAGSNFNLVDVEHFTDGHVYFQMLDSAGGGAIFAITAAFNPVAGTPYTFLMQYDFTLGASKLFIDGTQIGTTQTATATRTGAVAYGAIGDYYAPLNANANFKIKNLAFYDTVVTPGSPVLPAAAYMNAEATLPLFTYAGLGSVQAFTAFAEADAGTPRYTMNGMYWSGSAWTSSDGSYAQASSKATVIANIGTLAAANTLQVDAIFAAGSMQSQIGVMTVTYSGQIYPTSNPTIAPNTALTMDSLSAFTAVLAAAGSDGVRFYLMIGPSAFWWDSAAWSMSNQTYAQTNTPAEIATNASTLPISLGAFVTPFALLHSADGSTTPNLTSLTLTYDYFAPAPPGPNLCTLFGYIVDETDQVVVGATVIIDVPVTFFNQGITVSNGQLRAVTDSIGYFSITIVETTTPNVALNISVSYPLGNPRAVGTWSFGGALIPNQPSANIASLTFAS